MEHQKTVSRLIKSTDESTGFQNNITKPTACRGGGQILKKEEEDAEPLARCEENRKGVGMGGTRRW